MHGYYHKELVQHQHHQIQERNLFDTLYKKEPSKLNRRQSELILGNDQIHGRQLERNLLL